MTLFTKRDCQRCDQLKDKYDLDAMRVQVEVLDGGNPEALAHLAWHGLVDTARKTLPILVLDDSSTVDDFARIDRLLQSKAFESGISISGGRPVVTCDNGSCALN